MRRVSEGLSHSKRRKCNVPDIDNASSCTAKKTWMTSHYPVKINNITIVILFITAVSLDCDSFSLTFHNIGASASPHASIAQFCNSKYWPTVVCSSVFEKHAFRCLDLPLKIQEEVTNKQPDCRSPDQEILRILWRTYSQEAARRPNPQQDSFNLHIQHLIPYCQF